MRCLTITDDFEYYVKAMVNGSDLYYPASVPVKPAVRIAWDAGEMTVPVAMAW